MLCIACWRLRRGLLVSDFVGGYRGIRIAGFKVISALGH
jgi:hypothetical protein